MLTVTLIGPTYRDIVEQLQLAKGAELLEFRFDLFTNVEADHIASICEKNQGRLLFTFKNALDITKYLSLGPNIVDLDESLFKSFADLIKKALPNVQLICSKHYATMKEAMEGAQLLSMPADFIKIAAPAVDPLDGYRLREKFSDPRYIPVCMGDGGSSLRILGKALQIPITYAASSSGKEAARGQVPIDTMLNLYQFTKQNEQTKVFGLIGDPVDVSVGHYFHNQFFQQQQLNCVYVKQRVREKDLHTFFQLAAPIFSGLSVTMPLKTKVLPFLDSVTKNAEQIGVVNTLVHHEGRWIGTNTDGIGAMVAMTRKSELQGKKMLLFGTGATTRSIIVAAKEMDVEILVSGRDDLKAKKLAREFGVESIVASKIETQCSSDLLFVQTTSIGMYNEKLPFDFTKLSKESLVFDVAVQFSPLLQWAKATNRTFVSGREMFIAQAIEQLKFWQQYESFDPTRSPQREYQTTEL